MITFHLVNWQLTHVCWVERGLYLDVCSCVNKKAINIPLSTAPPPSIHDRHAKSGIVPLEVRISRLTFHGTVVHRGDLLLAQMASI